MVKNLCSTLLALAALSVTPIFAAPPENPDPKRYMFEDEIKPGMKGYGLTCMRGGKIEKFDIEVIDVMKNYAPGSNAILIKCAGLNLEHSGVIAGMSGSPIFIDERMVGAVAFDWPLGKDPVAGVQPIRQMLSIPSEKKKVDGKVSAKWTGERAAEIAGKSSGYSALVKSMSTPAARKSVAENFETRGDSRSGPKLQPIAAPVMVSGVSAAGMKILKAGLVDSTLVPIESGAGGGARGPNFAAALGGVAALKQGEIKLEPGSSIAIPLLSGDIDISAMGTVTEVRDGKVYAFGHAMFADGATDLPIATGYIYTIMANLQQSFKLGSSLERMGALVTDEQTGIVGVMGEKPGSVPISLRVHSGDGAMDKTYKYEMTQHPKVTPMMLKAIFTETLTAQRTMPTQYTARISGEIKFENGSININAMGTSQGFDLSDAIMPIVLLTDNPFKNLKMVSMNLEAKVEPVDRTLTVRSVTAAKDVVAPGEEVQLTVEVEPFHQARKNISISVTVPKDTPDGDYNLVVGGSDMAILQEAMSFPHRFDPNDIDSLTAALKNILSYSKDKIYARMVLGIEGAAKNGKEFANIPQSKVAIYASERMANASPLRNSVMTSIDAGGVVDGGSMISITVNKDANKRFFKKDASAFKLPTYPIGPMPEQPASKEKKSGSEKESGPFGE